MSESVVSLFPHDPYSLRRRTAAKRIEGRYRIDAFINDAWIERAQKSSAKLETVIRHADNSYSPRIRIVDNILGKPLYEREPDNEELFERLPVE